MIKSKYGFCDTAVSKCKRSIIGNGLFSIFFVICTVIQLTKINEDEIYDESGLFYTLTSIAFILLAGVFFRAIIKANIVMANLKETKYEIKETYVCGYTFSDMGDASTGRYFELKYEDIRSIESKNSGTYGSKQLYNLFINHKEGTYKLCIDNWDSAVRATNHRISEIEKQNNVSEVQ